MVIIFILLAYITVICINYKTLLYATQAHWKYVTLHTFLQNLKCVSPGTIHCTFRVKRPLEALNGFEFSPFQIQVRKQTILVNNVLSSQCTLIVI